MRSLHVHRTETTPEVDFDPEANSFKICGESRPENIRKFYETIFDWFDDYFIFLSDSGIQPNINLQMAFEYFNTSTAKMIYDLLIRLSDNVKKTSGKIMITWQYDSLDEDILESGKELQRFTGLRFDFKLIN